MKISKNNKKKPKVLVIAGSDSGAGAGIQADIKSIGANGAYATTAITSITAQNTLGVQAIFDVPVKIIKAQIESVLSDIGADIIKTGMLSDKKIISLVAETVKKYKIPLVLDPVMVAKGGNKLLKDDAIKTLKAKLIPLAYLLTPNIPEAEVISEMKIKNTADMEKAAKKIIADFGCNAVLLKGGHLKGDRLTDILVCRTPYAVNSTPKNKKTENRVRCTVYHTKRIKTKNTHGTGCTYASAIAANLAKQITKSSNHLIIRSSDNWIIESSVKSAHSYLQNAIKAAIPIGKNPNKGHSPVEHFLAKKIR